MRFQVVVQLRAESSEDFERMLALEEELIGGLGDFAEVDGHDSGQGEINLFVHTDEPDLVFNRIRTLPVARRMLPELAIAYRRFDSDDFKILFPEGLGHFEVR